MALLISGGATTVFLLGVSVGLAVGLDWLDTGALSPRPPRWSDLGKTLLLFVAPMAPIVAALERRRAAFWWVVAGVGTLAFVSWLAWLELASPAGSDAVIWAAVEALGFVLGLLFFDFVYGMLAGAGQAERARGA